MTSEEATENAKELKVEDKKKHKANAALRNRATSHNLPWRPHNNNNVLLARQRDGERATQGLARLGSKAALSFAFAFLK